MIHRVAAIVPAAGASRRFGGAGNKLFAQLRDQPVLAYALQTLQRHPLIGWIIPVVRPQDAAQVQALVRRYRIVKALPSCPGGASRAESVARGVAALPSEARWVLVHDGARPCVRSQVIRRAVDAARRHGAAACGLPAHLTVKAVDEREDVRVTLDRDSLWFAQTPQVFRRDWLAVALDQARNRLTDFPDDAAILESAGFPVRMVAGDPRNLKVTTPEDLVLAEAFLRSGAR